MTRSILPVRLRLILAVAAIAALATAPVRRMRVYHSDHARSDLRVSKTQQNGIG
jgi:hypothetical protein